MKTNRVGSIVVLIALLFVSRVCLAQGPDRSNPPKAGPPAQLKLAPIQHLKLSNGVPLLLLEKHDVPLVQINLVIRAGSAMDTREKAGCASMTADMMTEGAGARNALELADAIDYLGAQLSVSAGMHTTTVDLFTPLSKLDSAIALMADVVLRPTFPTAELERNRKDRLTSLLQWRDEPRQLASVMAARTLFGDSHPYGVPTMGDEKTLRGLNVEDLRQFHRQYFQANNATLIVVGDVKATAILPKLENAFGGWKSGTIPSRVISEPKQVADRSIVLIDKPGAAQSEIRIGRIGAPRLTDDYFAIIVMNTILGGSFTSRLNNNLREQHGYTYGAGSYFDFRVLPGPFLAYSAVQTAVTDKALGEFMKELNGILQPVQDADVERAKNYVALSFPGDFQTVGQIAHQLVQLVAYGLPDDYFNTYVGRILAVTKQDVERVAKKYIDPTKIAIIVCGDRAQIETGVRALNLGPMNVLTVEDVLGKAPVVGEE
jgi:zinc protease